ncbi:jg14166, partial [Pararge aegeria aegeria]
IKKQFVQQPQSATVEAGRQVTFHCSPPPAAPPATIKWVRNGVTIEATDETLVLPRVGLQWTSSIDVMINDHRYLSVQMPPSSPECKLHCNVRVYIRGLEEHNSSVTT